MNKFMVCKLMLNYTTGLDVVCSLTQHKGYKERYFLTERLITRLSLKWFMYLGPKFWSSVLFGDLSFMIFSLFMDFSVVILTL